MFVLFRVFRFSFVIDCRERERNSHSANEEEARAGEISMFVCVIHHIVFLFDSMDLVNDQKSHFG